MKILSITFACLLLAGSYTNEIFAVDANGKKPVSEYVPNEIIIKFKRPVADTLEAQPQIMVGTLNLSRNLDKLNARHRVKTIKPLFKNFKKNRQRLRTLQQKNKTLLGKKEQRMLRRLVRAPKGTKIPELDRVYKLKLEKGQSLQEVVAAYNNDPDVEYAELNYILSTCKGPNDLLYPVQWSLNNIGQMYPESGLYNHPPGTPDADIDAPEAWDIHTGSSDIVVAVIDSGVDYTHRDIQANMWVNEAELNGTAGVDDDGNGYIDDIYGYDFSNNDADPGDDHGHGTHCSGTIAAVGNNGLDLTGVCWNAKIMALKFLNSVGYGDTDDAIEAFYYAVENGADVTSNSWGGGPYSQAMEEAINYAHSQGVVMVAAAGNDDSTDPQYPAYHDNMISVAATNSNEQRASFSTYGFWVDIAAPGVDILSLRAQGTSKGTPYDAYTTILSGTSMACPHVAGSCALLLSINPFLTSDEVYSLLIETVDPISPEVCLSGRLNLLNAAKAIYGLVLDHDYYSCSDVVEIYLADTNLAGQGSILASVTTSAGDYETVTLTERTPSVGVFDGTISTESGYPNTEDTILQVSHGEIITATYADKTDTATVDCEQPVVIDMRIGFPGRQPRISIDTDELTTVRVLCGVTCGGPYIIDVNCRSLATSHSVDLVGVSPETEYFFIIEAADAAGNTTIDDKDGQCYSFTTTGPGSEIYVPAQCQTIQEGINNSWDGDGVWVSDGIYTGYGNSDLDFKGKPITLSSENGPENCIIDCNGTVAEQHRAFLFHSGEDTNSVLDGFTITNGYIPGSWYIGIGGGILCMDGSSPTITNCIITKNSAGWDGGGICILSSSPVINNCTFNSNSAIGNDGGAINNERSSPIITSCKFTTNSAYDWGGAIRNVSFSSPIINNCIFTANVADDGGAMYYYQYNKPIITNCTFAGNLARYGNAIGASLSTIQIANSIFADSGDEIRNVNSSSILDIRYSNIYGGWPGQGNIDVDPCFINPDSNDYHLRSDSPCINTGNPDYIPEPDETDLDGLPRVIAGRIDMGVYEFDSRPIADPGPNQTLYTDITRLAQVTLDGSASYDDDSDPLTYLWSWTIDSNTYQATGVSPTIQLPAGEHIIELIVSDSIDDSEPNEVVITLIGPMQAHLWLSPQVINRHSQGPKRIMALIRLPDGITKDQINECELLKLCYGDSSIEAVNQFIFDIRFRRCGFRHAIIFAKFNTRQLLSMIPDNGRVRLQAVGLLQTGQFFTGRDTIIIKHHRRSWWRRWRHEDGKYRKN